MVARRCCASVSICRLRNNLGSGLQLVQIVAPPLHHRPPVWPGGLFSTASAWRREPERQCTRGNGGCNALAQPEFLSAPTHRLPLECLRPAESVRSAPFSGSQIRSRLDAVNTQLSGTSFLAAIGCWPPPRLKRAGSHKGNGMRLNVVIDLAQVGQHGWAISRGH